jgi:hypothetical protein
VTTRKLGSELILILFGSIRFSLFLLAPQKKNAYEENDHSDNDSPHESQNHTLAEGKVHGSDGNSEDATEAAPHTRPDAHGQPFFSVHYLNSSWDSSSLAGAEHLY